MPMKSTPANRSARVPVMATRPFARCRARIRPPRPPARLPAPPPGGAPPAARPPRAPWLGTSDRGPPTARFRPAIGGPSRAASCAPPRPTGGGLAWRRLMAISIGRPVRRSTLTSPRRTRMRPESRMGISPERAAEMFGVEAAMHLVQPVQQREVAGARALGGTDPGRSGGRTSLPETRGRPARRRGAPRASAARDRESRRSRQARGPARTRIPRCTRRTRRAVRLTITVRLAWVRTAATPRKPSRVSRCASSSSGGARSDGVVMPLPRPRRTRRARASRAARS